MPAIGQLFLPFNITKHQMVGQSANNKLETMGKDITVT
jgi:hypothetical protein